MNNKIKPTHLERRAVVYLRQSTMKQVHENRESTARQYGLRQRAAELGWAPEAIQVVDEDLGHSGTSTEGREGFRRLAEDVAHCRVGAIFALEPSRLARNSVDWHRLLEICVLADVLIADEQGIYAPCDPNDRLLLGLKGQMSEAEQYWMRLRLQGGKLSKARRGELYMQPGPGYQWDAATMGLRLDPDEQVQGAVRLVFERFRIDGSACAVMRYLVTRGLRIPARTAGTADVRWVVPRRGPILEILRNPIYTGAYVWGRREQRVTLVDGERRSRRFTRLPRESWKVCLHNQHPAYITWEEYMANQEKLHQNRTNHTSPDQRGAAREGAALLPGLMICGRCGQRMNVRYQGVGQWQYECRSPRRIGVDSPCWTVSGRLIDKAVAALFLEAAQPPEIEICLAVSREAERQAQEIDHQWKLRLDRVRYEALLAERRYKAVDPDNRVVARTLEREWEEKLREVEHAESEYETVCRRERVQLDDEDRARILELARDLPRLWHASSTTPAQRKNLLRLLIREVALSPIDLPRRQTKVQVLWETGAVSELMVDRPTGETVQATSPEVVDLVRELGAKGLSRAQIAAELNRLGQKTGKGRSWDEEAVGGVRSHYGLQVRPTGLVEERTDGLLTSRAVAARFGVTVHIVRYWVERGWLRAKRVGNGPLGYELDGETIERLEKAKASGFGPRPRRRNSASDQP